MEEVFKARIEPAETPEIEPQPFKPQELPSDSLKGNETKATDEATAEEKKLDIWEGLNKRKYITEFFNIKEYAEEFNLKMQTAQIDKFVKSELEKRDWEKNTENWEKILSEIEEEIGSGRMELFARIKKLTGYINAVNRLNKAKELKEKFINSTE